MRLIRRAWRRSISTKGVPEYSRAHLWEEGRMWSLCGVSIPRWYRETVIEAPEGIPHCRRCQAIAQTGIDTGQQAVALAVFVVIGTLGPGLPVAIYFALGARAKRVLDELTLWMAGHTAAIMAVLGLVIGAKLIGDAITGLS